MSETIGSRERATFVARDCCIACGDRSFRRLGGGQFDEPPLRSFLERDPWAVSPLPFLQGAEWEYVACNACGQAFHRYVLDDNWQARRFAEWMGEDAIRAFEQEHGLATFVAIHNAAQSRMAHVLRLERLTRRIRGDRAPRLLDFGCGFGGFLGLAALSGFDACGVDWDANRIKGCLGPGVRVYRDLGELESQERKPFDAITLFEVLEHLVEPREVIRSLRGWLSAGGILVLETPDCTGVREIRSRRDYACIHPLDHINGFTPATLVHLARLEGFEPLTTPAAWVTADATQAMKAAAKRALARLGRSTTQSYFRLQRKH